MKAGLLILFGLVLLLFNKPLMQVSSGLMAGIPSPMIYFGVVWLALILIMRVISSKTKNQS